MYLKNTFSTELGMIIHGDSANFLDGTPDQSVDLVFTSPPFPLIRKKEYGNVEESAYVEWLGQFGQSIHRVLKDTGSFVVDLGGCWNKGTPTRSLYDIKVILHLVEEVGFHLAQDFYWWNPSKMPSPAEWVTIRKIRVKDAVNKVLWFSKTEWPKASNERVLQPYSDAMEKVLANGHYDQPVRPSGHQPSDYFSNRNKGAIPPNLIAVANSISKSPYLEYCRSNHIKPHPARFPYEIPEFFIRMLTDKGDQILDPFGGSCTTGAVAERMGRKWVCIEKNEDYIKGAMGHFSERKVTSKYAATSYSINKPTYVTDDHGQIIDDTKTA